MMPHRCSLVSASAVLAVAVVAASVGRLVAAELTLGDRTFSYPDDYTLEVAAGPPLVDRPIEADFDSRGRLYVTESSGSNEPVEEQLKNRPHRVLRLSDTTGDGIFDTRTVFADGLMFPAGCLWHEGSLYVSAPPQIWKLTDADDDGVAEKREVWFDGKTLTGCANDLHGPYRGPDGLIYWCKGAFAEQTHDLPGKPGWTTTAAHVFRARAGANGPESIEPVFTAGMDNPVGLAWTPEGDLIVAGTFFQHPGGGQRDGLIHAVRGGVWGKDHDVLNGHPRTGALMPPMTHLGPAAPAGLTRYGRDLLCAQFNMRKVSRHALTPEGATYKTTDTDFLSCDHPDFHPTDVFQAPDGSVLVIDTGGWYKLCCPTSQVAKPNVLGAVYRLRKNDGEVPTSVPAPRWAAAASNNPSALIDALATASPHLRREAAEVVASLGLKPAVPTLLAALASPDLDRFLFHAYANALREIGDVSATRPGLAHDHPAVCAAALYALEQMPGGALTVNDVLQHLGATDEQLRQAALFVIERHPDWADALAGWMRAQLSTPDAGGDTLRRVLAALGGNDRIQVLLGTELAEAKSEPARLQLLGAMAALNLKQLPESWRSGLGRSLAQREPRELDAALLVIRQAAQESRIALGQSLAVVSREAKFPPGIRLAAMAALGEGALPESEFRFVLAQLGEAAHGSAAAGVLASRQLRPAQLREVAGAFADAGLLERPVLLKSFAGMSDESAGLALVAALEKSHALAAAPPDILRDTFAKFPERVQNALAAAQAKTQAPDQAARLADLETSLPAGDVERGLIVFQSTKAACSTCHPVGYKGGNLGPDLSKVGAIRTRRDLIESLVFPSASFVRSYEPVQITKQDDSITYGIVTNQGGDALTVATGAATPPVRVPRADVKQMTPGSFSLMPQGLDQILTPQELADVIAYLQSRR